MEQGPIMWISNIAVPDNPAIKSLPQPNAAPNGTETVKYEVYTNTTHLAILITALVEIQKRVVNDANVLPRCNAWFEIMSRDRGRYKRKLSFQNVWLYPDILICFWPLPNSYLAMTSGNFITISERTFAQPNAVAAVGGTIVHEMAHWAGADGGFAKDAEASLEFCGFNDVRVPGLQG